MRAGAEPNEDFHLEAVPHSRVAQERGRPLALVAEMEIRAHRHPPHRQRLDEEAGHEVFCLDLRELARERHHHDAIEPQRLGKPRLLVGIGQAEHEGLGREHVARMRLEGQHDRRHAQVAGARLQRREHALVPAMAAVEIADGDHGPLEGTGHLVEAGEPDKAAQSTTRCKVGAK